MADRLDPRTGVAMVNVAGSIFAHLRPEVVAEQEFEGSSTAWVAGRRGIVTGSENL